jgi:hypothetical protein
MDRQHRRRLRHTSTDGAPASCIIWLYPPLLYCWLIWSHLAPFNIVVDLLLFNFIHRLIHILCRSSALLEVSLCRYLRVFDAENILHFFFYGRFVGPAYFINPCIPSF